MARKPKTSAVAEAATPEIVGLKKPTIPARSAQAAAAALTEAGFGVPGSIAASAGAAEPIQQPVPPAVAGADQ